MLSFYVGDCCVIWVRILSHRYPNFCRLVVSGLVSWFAVCGGLHAS